MFSFIIEFLNREWLYADFFVPPPPQKIRKRTRKPRDTGPQPPAGGQAVDAMALDAVDQDPASEAPPSLQPPLEVVWRNPRKGRSSTSASAVVKRNPLGLAEALMEPSVASTASPLPSLTPSPSADQPALRTYMEPAGRTVGLFRTPSLLAGQKHSLTPSPPSLPPSYLPTSPPPPVGLRIHLASCNWRDWIK